MPVTESKAAAQPVPNKWGPYANAGDFTTNTVITVVVLLCGLLLGLLLARRCRRLADDPEKQAGASKEATTFPALLFSAGTKFIGTVAECAICLADFVEGERTRVLPACNHGFHVQCVDQWLATRPSCPTCRVSCNFTLCRILPVVVLLLL